MSLTYPVVMSIAGVDPSGGAGIFADFRAIEAAGARALGAVTALTVQTEKAFFSYEPTRVNILEATIRSMTDAYPGLSVKTGMLPTAEIVENVAHLIDELNFTNVVIDPVIIASVGARLIDDSAEQAIAQHLVSRATLLTPNMPEAATLTGTDVTTIDEMKKAAEHLVRKGANAVVVTGGHLQGKSTDLLFDGDNFSEISAERLPGSVHGTGCSFASAAAAELAKGKSLNEAIEAAKKFVASLFSEQRWRSS